MRRVSQLPLLFLAVVVMMIASCSAESESDAWRALGQMKAKDYFAEPAQLKLAEAITSGNEQQLVKELKQGANANAAGRDGMRLLFWAMAKRNLRAFEILLQNGADPNVTATSPIEGERPLSIMELAAIAENSEYLRLVLAHKGNPNFPLGYGDRTIVHQAIMNERIENVRLLVGHGLDLSHRDMSGQSALLTAAAINAYDIVYLLLQNGADPSLKDRWGYDLAAMMKKFGPRGIAPGSEQFQWYQKVSGELKKRGLL